MKLVVSSDVNLSAYMTDHIREQMAAWVAADMPYLVMSSGLHLSIVHDDGTVTRVCHHEPHEVGVPVAEPTPRDPDDPTDEGPAT